MKVYIKKGITKSQFDEMGVFSKPTKKLLDGSHDSYYGEVDVYDGRKVFVFRDKQLPEICWVYYKYVIKEI